MNRILEIALRLSKAEAWEVCTAAGNEFTSTVKIKGISKEEVVLFQELCDHIFPVIFKIMVEGE